MPCNRASRPCSKKNHPCSRWKPAPNPPYTPIETETPAKSGTKLKPTSNMNPGSQALLSAFARISDFDCSADPAFCLLWNASERKASPSKYLQKSQPWHAVQPSEPPLQQ